MIFFFNTILLCLIPLILSAKVKKEPPKSLKENVKSILNRRTNFLSHGIIIIDAEDGLPTCDPAGLHDSFPYTGYRINYEVRIPFHDTEELIHLNYEELVRSNKYKNFFVLSVCDANFVSGEITLPLDNMGSGPGDVWNHTICSDKIPVVSNQPLSDHPFFDMFLNYRLQMFNRHEPDVREQYCFHLAKAEMFKNNKRPTPEWEDFLIRDNFVGGLYDCVDLNIKKHSNKTLYSKNGDIQCDTRNTKALMPLYRDAWKFIWAVLVAKDKKSSKEEDDINKQNLEENSLEWIVRIPWLYTPDIYDVGFPEIKKSHFLVDRPGGVRQKITVHKMIHNWIKNVHPFEKYNTK